MARQPQPEPVGDMLTALRLLSQGLDHTGKPLFAGIPNHDPRCKGCPALKLLGIR